MSQKPDTLAVDGLPPLTWERSTGWRCEVTIPAWAQLNAAAAVELESDIPSNDGEIEVSFGCPDIYARTPPSAAQVAAFQQLMTEADAIRDAVVQAAYREFQGWLAEEFAVRLTSPSQLEGRIALNGVGIGNEPESGSAPLDLDFSCSWDDEHGFMALVVDGQVTYVGPR